MHRLLIIKKIIVLYLLFLPVYSFSQYWKKTSYEGIYGIGATNFMADIGGPSTSESGIIKSNFWLTPQSFRPVFYGGMRFLNKNMGYRINFFLGSFSAADVFSDYWKRNLVVNTFFIEFSGQYEFYLIQQKGKRNIYRTKTFKWYKNLNVPTYLFVGAGGNLFYTKIERNERYLYEPFSTVPFIDTINNPEYLTFVFPFGIGIKYRLNREISFGMEAGYRFAFSDLLDGYSSENSNWPDSYQFLLFTLNYKLKTGRSGLPRFRFR